MSTRADDWCREEHATAIAERRGCWHCWGVAQAINAAKKGHVLAGFPTENDLRQNYMVINGERYPVINAWVEVESPSDGRKRWGIVTEPGTEVQSEQQPAAPTGATVSNCMQRAELHLPHEWHAREHAYWCKGDPAPEGPPSTGFRPPDRLTRGYLGLLQQVQDGPRYVERPSGPPVRVDGPGCTPLTVRTVPDEEDENEPHQRRCKAGHLWDEECEECS